MAGVLILGISVFTFGGLEEPLQYLLTVTIRGNGTVKSEPAGIHCGTECSGFFNAGAIVSLVALPAPLWQFDGWSGDPDCGDGRITMNANTSCHAIFTRTSVKNTWAKTYGGPSWDDAYSAQQTREGGFVVAGFTTNYGRRKDFWVLELDSDGNVKWQKAYHRISVDVAKSILQTTEGGYIVAGYTSPHGADAYDLWILKLTADGHILWQKTYGTPAEEKPSHIRQTKDGGYIIAACVDCETRSKIWILKLDSWGNVEWQKTYESSFSAIPCCIQQTAGGGYILAGKILQKVEGKWNIYGVPNALILKLDAKGQVVWRRAYGGEELAGANSLQQTADGGFILAGTTDLSGKTDHDLWILKLDSDGNEEWQKTYLEEGVNYPSSIYQTTDGGYVVAGITNSLSKRSSDAWVLKLNPSGNIEWQRAYGGSGQDGASSVQPTRDGGYIVAGYTYTFGAGGNCEGFPCSDVWMLKLDINGLISPDCPPDFSLDTFAITEDASLKIASSSISPKGFLATNTTIEEMKVTSAETQATVKTLCKSMGE